MNDRLKKLVPDVKHEPYYGRLFIILMLALCFVFILTAELTGGYSVRGLFEDSQYTTYMEFFNNALSLRGDPYAAGSYITPLAYVFYKIFLMMMPEATIQSELGGDTTAPFGNNVKVMQEFWVPFIIYTIILGIALYASVTSMKKGGTAERTLFFLSAMLSAPMLFALERGSSVLVSLALVLLYVWLRGSDRKPVREISYICLGAAIAFGVFPVIFLIVPLKEKKFFGAARAFIYAAVLTGAPLLLFRSKFAGISAIFGNYANTVSKNIFDVSGTVPFCKTIISLLSGTNIPDGTLLKVSVIFGAAIALLGIISLIIRREADWKTFALIACLISGLIPTSDTHSLVFMLIPCLMMADCEKEVSVKNYIYLCLMVLSVGLLLSGKNSDGEYVRFIATKISSGAVLALLCMLSADSIYSAFSKKADSKKSAAVTAQENGN